MIIYTKTQYRSGMKVALDDGRVGLVKSSVDLKWLGLSNGYCYATTIELNGETYFQASTKKEEVKKEFDL